MQNPTVTGVVFYGSDSQVPSCWSRLDVVAAPTGVIINYESLFQSSRFFSKIILLMDAIRWNGMYVDSILEHVVDQLAEYRKFPTWEDIVEDVYGGDTELAERELGNSSDATHQLFDVDPWKERNAQAATARKKSRREEEEYEDEVDED